MIAIGIAYNPNTDTYYARSFTNFYTVNPNTAALTLVGASGGFITGLTFNAAYELHPVSLDTHLSEERPEQ